MVCLLPGTQQLSKAEQSRAKGTNGQLQKPKPQKIYSGPASVPGTYRLAIRTPQRDPHGNGCQGAVAGVGGVSPAKNGIEPPENRRIDVPKRRQVTDMAVAKTHVANSLWQPYGKRQRPMSRKLLRNLLSVQRCREKGP